MTILREIELLTWFNAIEKLKSILRKLVGGSFIDAPSDGKIYARQDGQWVEVTASVMPTFQQIYDTYGGQIVTGEDVLVLSPTGIQMINGELELLTTVGAGNLFVLKTDTNHRYGLSVLDESTRGVYLQTVSGTSTIKNDDSTATGQTFQLKDIPTDTQEILAIE